MKIMRVPNPDLFLDAVDRCRGDVSLEIPGAPAVDLKTDTTARAFLGLARFEDGVTIRLSETSDLISLISYAAESRCSSAA